MAASTKTKTKPKAPRARQRKPPTQKELEEARRADFERRAHRATERLHAALKEIRDDYGLVMNPVATIEGLTGRTGLQIGWLDQKE